MAAESQDLPEGQHRTESQDLPEGQHRSGSGLIWGAAALGLLNAAPSFYWAFGGDALLDTIGQWLVDLRGRYPVLIGSGLLGIALGKSAAAVVPLVAVYGLAARRALWWNLSRVVALALILYGAAGTAINLGLLLWPGLTVEDPTARWGQALLWYPMLLLWGLVLSLGLRRKRVSMGGPSLE
ncbi:DUF3995 domain-containing protein [Nesterenkonia sp. Act20]|uniref:DUF3995 domain-containing protein n=1 Tax=Nesterenkonia sp. Act20 TaxID=1483432 RepID=UPI001C48126F|nr:DUF3995 domain-containing protein [Nesterenkonia sp. Act20]